MRSQEFLNSLGFKFEFSCPQTTRFVTLVNEPGFPYARRPFSYRVDAKPNSDPNGSSSST